MFKAFRYSALSIATTLALLCSPAAAHPDAPGAPQRQPIAIVGATVHTVRGDVLSEATVLFDRGRIIEVGRQVELPSGVLKIEAEGKHLYPGLMDSSSNLGLVEINAVRSTRDFAETGNVNPNVRAEKAVNPDSELIPVTRCNGVLIGVVTPAGGLISGRAAVMQWDGWTWEDMTLRADAALQVHWPRISGPDKEDQGKAAVPSGLRSLERELQAAADYRRAREAEPHLPQDIKLESLLPVIDGKVPLLVDADRAEHV